MKFIKNARLGTYLDVSSLETLSSYNGKMSNTKLRHICLYASA